ncbi:MAG: hypothetical protein O3C25_01955 [Chloroflexi bacterium]|nr:hypothetical protein [Chloroflexota bacterium]
MLLELRIYTAKPGRRDDFVRWFHARSIPAMEAAGMRILDERPEPSGDRFVWLRAFADEEERRRQYDAFFLGEAWLGGLRDEAYEMLERVDVHTMSIEGHATSEGWRTLAAELVPELVPPGRAAESPASG